jgi:hypothetical protein
MRTSVELASPTLATRMESFMKNNTLSILSACTAAFAAILCTAQPSFAVEPDDTAPFDKSGRWFGTTSTYLSGLTGASFWYEYISSSTDVDYHVVACGARKLMTKVDIQFTHSKGDLDLEVYTVDGTQVAKSEGVTDAEEVWTNGMNIGSVVLRVYGYRGATNGYYIGVACH